MAHVSASRYNPLGGCRHHAHEACFVKYVAEHGSCASCGQDLVDLVDLHRRAASKAYGQGIESKSMSHGHNKSNDGPATALEARYEKHVDFRVSRISHQSRHETKARMDTTRYIDGPWRNFNRYYSV